MDMKSVKITVPDNKLSLFLAWMKNITFVRDIEVSVNSSVMDEGNYQDDVTENLRTGLEEVRLFKKGKLKTTPAKSFLDEL